MPQLHLNIRNRDGFVEDFEGAYFADLQKAREVALISAREIMANRVSKGQDANSSLFEITDEFGVVLLVVHFAEAMR